jgi:hypothetical protein
MSLLVLVDIKVAEMEERCSFPGVRQCVAADRYRPRWTQIHADCYGLDEQAAFPLLV